MGEGDEDLQVPSPKTNGLKRAREVTPDPGMDSTLRRSKRQKRIISTPDSTSGDKDLRTSIGANNEEGKEERTLKSGECDDEREQPSASSAFNFEVTKRVTRAATNCTPKKDESGVEVLDPFSAQEARKRWPRRYCKDLIPYLMLVCDHPANFRDDESFQQAKTHYRKAIIDGIIYCLGDDAYVKADDEKPNYIARITEIFRNINGEPFFRAQWFFRAEDTVIQNAFPLAEKRRIFISDVRDDNPLNCIESKVKIKYIPPTLNLKEKLNAVKNHALYYDMKYSVPFFTFSTIKQDNIDSDNSTISSEKSLNNGCSELSADSYKKSDMILLDLYSGCGAMSTGLCMGAAKAGLNLVSRWAVDINRYACESVEKNHSETKVWNMAADDFLSLIKEWEKLCREFSLLDSNSLPESIKTESVEDEEEDDEPLDEDVYVVERILDVCFGDPNDTNKPGIHFKVRWKGYSPEDDTWEPLHNLRDCPQKLKEFVINGYKLNILPIPGNVDAICGGPPCQGISGFNRFRNTEAPLEDEKNKQLIVFMDIVEYLKPCYVLMENVVDILKFSEGLCGRYAIGRLVSLNYQARLGILAAGHYGVPQFRNRVFLWGCHPLKCLPQYPLPTHDALNRAPVPNGLKEITVALEMDDKTSLPNGLTLEDALFDLPPVGNGELKDVRSYGRLAVTDFQKHIRVTRNKIIGFYDHGDESYPEILFDHVPLSLSNDDYQRVCQIPKKKGANFRDLPGVAVDESNTVYFDPKVKRELLPSGKPLVPDYAMSYVRGKSTKPFGRLWWDETVPTVLTRAEPHNQIILHPKQNRVLTVRENARLQGFPDCYRLYGPIKEKYTQVGNAVAIPVAFAMGYCLGLAYDKFDIDSPLASLPFTFPSCLVKSADIQEAVVSD